MVIYKYYSTRNPDDWADGVEFDHISDARAHARSMNYYVVEAAFEFADTDLVEDYTGVNDPIEKDLCECCDNDPCVHADELPDGMGEP